jgi:hypothetical protein
MRDYELILSPIVGWACAQGIKFAISLRKDGIQVGDLFASGGFPSSHTASIVPITVILGLRNGITDSLFACMLAITALVMYDAIGVRRSNGEQYEAIKELAARSGKKLTSPVHKSRGHTPVEVIGGFVLGCIIGYAFYILG